MDDVLFRWSIRMRLTPLVPPARRWGWLAVVMLLPLGSCTAAPPGVEPEAPLPLRPFTADSWWNSPVPTDAPNHPDESAIVDYMNLARGAGDGCVQLAGASNDWGQPVYWTVPSDPSYGVVADMAAPPPEIVDAPFRRARPRLRPRTRR